MGERQEVEVVVPCHNCNGTGEAWYTHEMRQPLGCHVCSGARCVVKKVEVAPGSLTAARLRLADAAEALEEAERKVMNEFCFDEAGQVVVRRREYRDALAALRTKRAGG